MTNPSPKEVTFREKHFFWMPADCEMFLAALAAVQDYVRIVNEKRHIEVEMSLYCVNQKLQFLHPAAKVQGALTLDAILNPLLDNIRSDFDQAIRFDPDIAYRLSKATEKHAVQMFGIQLGSEPANVFPDLSACVTITDPVNDILLLPFPGSDKLSQFILNNHPELSVTTVPEGKPLPFWMHEGQDAFDIICRHRITVGVRSGMTYLAASIKRGLVEVYPTDKHRNWLSKWGNPHYQMVYGDAGVVHPSLIYRALEALLKRLEARAVALTPLPKIEKISDNDNELTEENIEAAWEKGQRP